MAATRDEPSDDAQLVARCLRGDTAAFEPLVRRYQRVLFTVAYRLTANVHDAEDAVQNAFVRAYTKLDSFDPRRPFFSWLYRIAVNETLNHKRGRRDHEPMADVFSVPDGLAASLERANTTARVRAAVSSLNDDLRDVVVLHYFAELPYEAVGEALGIPPKTVKSRLFSARQKLEGALGRVGG